MSRSIARHRTPAPSRSCGLNRPRWKGRALTSARNGRGRGDEGVSLVEVLVAAVILLITMIPIGYLLTSATEAATASRQHQAAQQLADSWIQILSNANVPTVPGSDGVTPLLNGTTTLDNAYADSINAPHPGPENPLNSTQFQFAGTNYAATATYTYNAVNDVGQSDLCLAGTPPSPSNPAVLQLQVNVSWGSKANPNQYHLSEVTNINYPPPGTNPDGFIDITVSNEGATDILGNSAVTRLEAVPVLVTQTSGSPAISPLTVYPDANGCIFVQVPGGTSAAPDTYTVALQQPTSGIPGYADTPPFVNSNNQVASAITPQQASVVSGIESVVPLGNFDEAMNADVSYGGGSAVDSGVQCPGAASLTCLTLGSGTTGASAAWGGAGAPWTSTTLSNGSHINQVACTTATQSKCVAAGYTTTAGTNVGLLLSTISDLNSTTPDLVPAGVTDIIQVTCPTNLGCYALGSNASGPVLLAGRVGPGTDVWQIISPPSVTFTALNSIACPTPNTCELAYAGSAGAAGVLRLDGDPAGVAGNPSWMPTITSDILPSPGNGSAYSFTSVGTITCPSATQCLATAVGDASSPTDATIAEATIASSGASNWGAEATFPTGATSVTGISCLATTCVAVGTIAPSGGSNAAVWTGQLTPTLDNWVQSNGIPPSVANVSGVACGQPAGTDTADCVVSAESSSGSGSGQLLVGSLKGNWAWNFAPPPSGVSPQYYQGVACENPPANGNTACAAVGESANGPVVLTSPNGPNGSWSIQTPSTLAGATVSAIPVQVALTSTTAWTPLPNLPPQSNLLYPSTNGYAVAAGQCASEAGVSSLLQGVPGATASATVPLGLLPLRLVNSSGAPVTSATVTLTDTSCGAGGTIYNMPVTDATGSTATSVPYGTYSYSVTVGSVAVAPTNLSLTVGPNTVDILNSLTPTVPAIVNYLPGLVQVPA
jgi:type II secretory pathway pseudopilin PulG